MTLTTPTSPQPQSQTSTPLRIEPSPRWVRGYVDAQPIVDSKHVLVVYGVRRTPSYFFPRSDVRVDQLQPSQQADGKQFWSLQLGGRRVEDIAWGFLDTSGDRAQLADHLAFDWPKVEAWYEEDEEVFVHPRDPHHRVDILDSSRHIKVVIDGETVAESHRPRLLFETGLVTRYYLPKMDVRMDLLEPTPTQTQCPYKGNASYWSAKIGGAVHQDIVWSYPFPTPESAKIKNLLSFYNEKVDLYVDGELQPKAPARH